MASSKKIISTAGQLVASGTLFAAATSLQSTTNPSMLLSLGAAVGGNLAHQYFNSFCDAVRIKELLARHHPNDLNRDVERLLKAAALQSVKYLETIVADTVKQQLQQGRTNGPEEIAQIKRVEAYFTKQIRTLKNILPTLSVSHSQLHNPTDLVQQLSGYFFRDIPSGNQEPLWQLVKAVFEERMNDLFLLSFYESVKKDEKGMRAFSILMLTDLRENLHQLVTDQTELKRVLLQLNDRLAGWEQNNVELIHTVHLCVETHLNRLARQWEELGAEIINRLGRQEGQLSQVKTVLKEVHTEVLQLVNHSAHGQPKLRFDYTAVSRNKMVFKSRHFMFVGRQKEMTDLKRFCQSNELFAWWIMYGAGGSGKSRLAMEFCFEPDMTGWHRGFLQEEELRKFNWDQWEPDRDTLLLIDYVARYPSQVLQLLETVFDRIDKVRHKVRFLLLEREVDAQWRNRFKKSENDSIAPIWEIEYHVPQMDHEHLLSMMEQVIKENGRAVPPRKMLFDRLNAVDRLHRPLYALIVASSFFGEAGTPQWEKQQLFEYYLLRENESLWKAQQPDATRLKQHLLLAILSTMAGGLSLTTYRQARYLFPQLLSEEEIDVELIRLITGSFNADADRIEPIEPDIIGEYIVPYYLFTSKEKIFPFSRHVQDLITMVWQLNPVKFSDFLIRSIKDFPEENFIVRYTAELPVTTDKTVRFHYCNTVLFSIDFFEKKDRPFETFFKVQFEKLRSLLQDETHPDLAILYTRAIAVMAFSAAYTTRPEQMFHYLDELAVHLDRFLKAEFFDILRRTYERLVYFYLDHPQKEITTILLDKLNAFNQGYRFAPLIKSYHKITKEVAEYQSDQATILSAFNLVQSYIPGRELDPPTALKFFKAACICCYHSAWLKNMEAAYEYFFYVKSLFRESIMDDRAYYMLKDTLFRLVVEKRELSIENEAVLNWLKELALLLEGDWVAIETANMLYERAKGFLEEGDVTTSARGLADMAYLLGVKGHPKYAIYSWAIHEAYIEFYSSALVTDKVVYHYEQLKLMLNAPRKCQDIPVLAGCAGKLSDYFRWGGDITRSEKYKAEQKQIAKDAGLWGFDAMENVFDGDW